MYGKLAAWVFTVDLVPVALATVGQRTPQGESLSGCAGLCARAAWAPEQSAAGDPLVACSQAGRLWPGTLISELFCESRAWLLP